MTRRRVLSVVVLLAALACRLGAQTPEQPAPPATTVQPTATRQQTSFPFRVCELSSHGDLFRFSSDIQCPSFGTRENHTEGLLMVFKDNIIPYSFKVRSYTKIVTNILIYNGWYADSVTNRHEEKFSVESYETDQMDTIYQCYNAVKMTKDGLTRVYVDRDGVNITVNLKPTGGLANGVRRYASQTELYDAPGWLIWTYRTRTTVNCLITDMMAKSNSPFDFFVTTTGQTVEMSPFYDGKNTETFHERADSFHVRTNYKIVDYDNRGTNPQGERRAFLDKGTYTLSWKLENRTAYCPLQHWQTFDSTIATETGKSIHFVTDEGTSSFVTNTTVGIELPDAFKCIEEQVNKTMHEKYEAVQDRYTKGQEAITYFITSGGLLLAWLPLTPRSLATVKNLTELTTPTSSPPSSPSPPAPPAARGSTSAAVLRRRRRNAGNATTPVPPAAPGKSLGTLNNPATVQIQFAYDSLRRQINRMLGDLARAWCLEQKRQNMVLRELTKINPTTVMSSIYGKAVAAKRLGDVISVSQCVPVNQATVTLRKSMRVPGSETMCYSRPLVSFSFINDTKTYEGQLGTDNEIFLTKKMTEVCQATSQYYFQSGNEIHVYNDYHHFKTIELDGIATLQTFISLNTSLIENIDFASLELYSRDEQRASNVFDLEGIFREYNFQAQNIAGLRKDLDNAVSNGRNQFVDGLGELMDSLGSVGQSITNLVSTVGGLFSSLVSGFISFFKNPFGGMLILVLVVGVVILVISLTRRTRQMSQQPVQMLYPGIDELAQQHASGEGPGINPISKTELQAIMLALHEQNQEQKRAAQRAAGPSVASRALQAARDRFPGLRRRRYHDPETAAALLGEAETEF
ncbi:UNVERIFIED_ASMBLY: envelope glycoprotein B [human gammaherpesvirus 4]|uniref:BALF4 n=1 Tax=Epstein-Barr virus (strain GD1) TaxID=10376 RepID=R4R670_EBVG|nr:BALF4 [human gammaherpesvirus 4]AGZ95225.1 BALF4 [human gammaherpesvirus 4]AIE88493.1 glycoprotein BALF4 [human gammaherpesvirus 4]AIE88570.1 glycoprotein BALF4 [human gammaherpesvirus 4]AIE88646.1 glycoprotein BALF4 [human gammaherpesvirus 4]